MQKLAEAKELKHKAQIYASQGNYEQAIRDYKKINILLKEATLQSKSEETISHINAKMQQFQKIIEELKEHQRKALEEKKKMIPHIEQPKQKKQQVKANIVKVEQSIPQDLPEHKTKLENNNVKKQLPQIKKPDANLNNKRLSVPVVPIDPKKIAPKPIPKKQPTIIPKKQAVIIERKPIIPTKKQSNSLENKKPGVNAKKLTIDPAVEELIIRKNDVKFQDIVGLEDAKEMLEQAVIRPIKRPDLYTGIRAPPRALLLYGPPGNGKTYLCKALANQSGCTFIALSASSILNKYVGESEKTIKKIFWTAQKLAEEKKVPSIIFIDEIDSMLTARTQNQNDASRRLKTEFLVLMDGISSPKSGEILVIGATNLPKQLDNAAKRRFSKFIYIGNPNAPARKQMVLKNLKGVEYDLSQEHLCKIVESLQYFSASQIRNIVAEACMYPLRQLKKSKFQKVATSQIRKVNVKDFMSVISERKPIVSPEQLAKFKQKV